MKTKPYYTLTIDGKEMAKSTLLSEVALKTPHVENHYEIAKHEYGEITRTWGFTVNPVTGQKSAFSTDKGKNVKPSPIPNKMKKAVFKVNCFGRKMADKVATLKREYKVRKNLKLLEKKVELFDL